MRWSFVSRLGSVEGWTPNASKRFTSLSGGGRMMGSPPGDLIDVMAPLYPGESEEQMTEHMKSWSLKNRLAEHYAARRRIPQ